MASFYLNFSIVLSESFTALDLGDFTTVIFSFSNLSLYILTFSISSSNCIICLSFADIFYLKSFSNLSNASFFSFFIFKMSLLDFYVSIYIDFFILDSFISNADFSEFSFEISLFRSLIT